MKKILFTSLLILIVSMSFARNRFVARGESNSDFGNYRIEKLDGHFNLDNKQLDQYQITYDKSNLKLIVALDAQKKCRKYYVLSDRGSVQYECNGTSFGIKKLDKKLAAKGFQTNLSQLNKTSFFQQRILISGEAASQDHLALIASYYPALLE
ncbi:MAG: hypothetical protein LWW85_03760 [Marinilabiliales bacterium]|nr:hypothetical protein [Marinilabiliales bacterium]